MRSLMLLTLITLGPAGVAGPATKSSLARLDAALRKEPYQGFLALLEAADRRWAEVRSYSGILEKEERRQGKLQPKETINCRFMRDHAVRMEWLAPEQQREKRVLYVHGQYRNKLNVQARKILMLWRVQFDPLDPEILENTNHPITESGFGQSLRNIRQLSMTLHGQGRLEVLYGGRGQSGPAGRPCFRITRNFKGYDRMTRSTIWLDEATLMPVQIEAHDRMGFLERYSWPRVSLDPELPGGQDELTVRDFYRGTVFSDHRPWRKRRDSWTFEDIAPVWLGGKRTIRF